MKKFAKYTAFLLACMTVTAFSGCEGKTDEESQVSVISDVTTSEEATVPETTTEPITEQVTEESTETPTEETVPDENNSDYRTVLDAYHQAYLDGNADAVYALFSPDEITAFDTYMKTYLKNNLGESEETVENMFAKDNVVSAINGSIENIHGIMANYSVSDGDIWSINIDETTIEHYSADELARINSDLSMNITDGYMCEIPFYKNNANEEVFVAEPASIFQIDGKWYISYSVACDRLIEFMDIEF